MSLFLITADKSAVTVKKVYSSYNLLTYKKIQIQMSIFFTLFHNYKAEGLGSREARVYKSEKMILELRMSNPLEQG